MIALKLKNVSKCFDNFSQDTSFTKRILSQIGITKGDKTWALKNINFDVKKGECIGIIGDNGSGKSTLLKIIAGVTKPSQGSVHINGKIGSFLELGIGFQGELNGEENIFLYASLLGIKKSDIKKVYNRIIELSELKDAIKQPIKSYSSGMLARLAFSVLAFTNSDILLLDEVATVGDHSFKQKSLNKLLEFKRKGKTILLVSHNISELSKICDKCILLEKGNLDSFGDIKSVATGYIDKTNQKNKAKLSDQINKEESENQESTRLLYLYNELDIVLENMITANKERTTHTFSKEELKKAYQGLIELYEERELVLKKILNHYKKGNIKTDYLLMLNKSLLDILENLQELYKYDNYNKADNKVVDNYKKQISLFKEIIRIYKKSHNDIRIIEYYKKITSAALEYSKINKREQKLILLDIQELLKKSLKTNEFSEDLLKCFIRVTQDLSNISDEKEKGNLLKEIKNYNKSLIKNESIT